MWKIGARNNMLRMGWLEAVEAAGEIGFDGVELDVVADWRPMMLYSEEGRTELAAAAEAAGVEVASICVGAFWRVPPSHPGAEVRAEATLILRETIVACGALGIGSILAPLTGNDETAGEDVEEQRQRWVAMLKEVAPVAEEQGVYVGIENCCRDYAASSPDQIRIVDAVGNSFVGAYYDCANGTVAGYDAAQELRDLGHRVTAFHVKDTGGNHLGEGEVNLPAVAAALREIGYRGYLVLETPPKDDPVASAKRNLEYTRRVFCGVGG